MIRQNLSTQEKRAGIKKARPKVAADKRSQLAKDVEIYVDIIESGSVLAIDPSGCMGAARPGYAYFESGKLAESGIINIMSEHRNRLWALGEAMKDFEKPHLLVVEMINFSAGGKSSGALQKAIGVIMSTWNIPVLSVAPATWKKYLHLTPWYTKSDIADAILIGQAVIWTLQEQQRLKLESIPKPKFL